MSDFLHRIRYFLTHRFNLQEDKAEEQDIISSIRKNIDFRGANLWALIFAIFIASIGLNVNSTAVIIGAMLISPIMGPVMAIGLGVGINDLEMVKKGGKNLLVATVISIITSTIYFSITPLHDAQSELLARTSPSIWDVFIALFGGMAGMVAASRKEKNNVIPGVAIATALMPPLCTAGFGLAMGNWYFFLGAIYLYFINSVFIAIATFLMTRYLKMRKKAFDDPGAEKRVTRYVVIIVLVTLLPSIYMAYRIVNKSIFENNARTFVEQAFNFKNTQVVSKSFTYTAKQQKIDLLLIGAVLKKPVTDSLRHLMKKYRLQNVQLNIRQGLNAKQELDLSQIKASILEDVYSTKLTTDTVKVPQRKINLDSSVLTEIKALYPAVLSFGVSKIAVLRPDTTLVDTQKVALVRFAKPLNKPDVVKLQTWLQKRYQSPQLKLISQ
ncbi:TIGR00341 family protein [Mucilaginibacter sp. AK015]|uniref:TIGR00341 family protein n=1 Tax=Mucilaginibacter sp. AK015 TaxID=2723072 RepID=UPI00160C505E|nr:TIGR00341 family protein [Mucilaginibacter sp. AK015]MBB5394048.1 putative hydrophobic protein (TIGR00271 family) [Mucilaginibacter sp. AK015]